jgi:preprotein translocase subunit SecA
VIDGEVMIIDGSRPHPRGRRGFGGPHQASRPRRACDPGGEPDLATITLQNYFRLYDKLAGMTGTALTEATEFMKIYKSPVVEIPTNQPMVRADQQRPDLQDQGRQVEGRVEEIDARHETGQPILVGRSRSRSRR